MTFASNVASKQKISIYIFYHCLHGACFVFCWFIAFLVLLLLFLDGLVLLCILRCVQRVQVLLFFGRFRIPSLCADAEKNKRALHFTIDGFLHFPP